MYIYIYIYISEELSAMKSFKKEAPTLDHECVSLKIG